MCGTWLGATLVKKTRKQHRCHGCDRRIPKGTSAIRWVSVDCRELFSDYLCLDCEVFNKTAAAKNLAEDDGCLYPGAFSEQSYAKFPILEPV